MVRGWKVGQWNVRAALVILVLGILAVAPGAAGAGGQDRVAGTAERVNLAGQAIHVHVNAQRTGAGEDATGHYWARRTAADGTETYHQGRVICLTVVGNRAAAGAIVEESTTPENPVGSHFQIQVTDNGSPGALNDTNINFFGFPPEYTGCEIIEFAEVPITGGNFVVFDADE